MLSSAVGLYVTTYYIGGALGGFVPAVAWQRDGWAGVVAVVMVMLIGMMALAIWQWPRRVVA